MVKESLIFIILFSLFSFKAFSEANYKCFAESLNGGKKIEQVEFFFQRVVIVMFILAVKSIFIGPAEQKEQ